MKFALTLSVLFFAFHSGAATSDQAKKRGEAALLLATEVPIEAEVSRVCEFKALVYPRQSAQILGFGVGPYDVTVNIADSYLVEYKSNGWYSTLAYVLANNKQVYGNFGRFYIFEGTDMKKLKNHLGDLLTTLQLNEITLGECFEFESKK